MSLPPRWLLTLQFGTFLLLGCTAALALPLLLLWVLGVPGVDNDYARGWALGLATLGHYLVGSLGLLLLYGAIALLRRKIPQAQWGYLPFSIGAWGLFGYAGVRLYQAFRLMGMAP